MSEHKSVLHNVQIVYEMSHSMMLFRSRDSVEAKLLRVMEEYRGQPDALVAVTDDFGTTDMVRIGKIVHLLIQDVNGLHEAQSAIQMSNMRASQKFEDEVAADPILSKRLVRAREQQRPNLVLPPGLRAMA